MPTAAEMRKFAARFSAEEWALLSHNQQFLDTISVDVGACRRLSERIIGEAARQKALDSPEGVPA
jgi:hypothetical protein